MIVEALLEEAEEEIGNTLVYLPFKVVCRHLVLCQANAVLAVPEGPGRAVGIGGGSDGVVRRANQRPARRRPSQDRLGSILCPPHQLNWLPTHLRASTWKRTNDQQRRRG